MKAKFRHWRGVAIGFGIAVGLLAAVQFYPNVLFEYSRSYRGFTIASDRPIDAAVVKVIDDTRRRLSTSPMSRSDDRFRVFICNSWWRLLLFTDNSQIGGGTVYLSRNIFIRAADIPSNTIRSPSAKPLLDLRQRPLSYFLAHEATHVLQLRRYGLIVMLRSPFWLVEGHADHVAKAGDFDIAANRSLLRRNDPLLAESYGRRGLYRRYQLLVETALGEKGATIDTLFFDPPPQERLLVEATK